jgi:signal transduction histidine kinase
LITSVSRNPRGDYPLKSLYNSSKETKTLSTVLSVLYGWLIKPPDSIQEPGQRRTASLLSSVILILLIASFINANLAESIPALVLVLLLLGYIFSRTKYFYVAGMATIVLLSFPSYNGIFINPDYSSVSVHSRIAWITLPLIIGSLFLPTLGVAIYAVANFIAILLLPAFIPGLESRYVISSLGYIGTLSFLFIVTMRNRDNLEKIRQKALRALNIDLEERIKERTAQLEATNKELEAFAYSISHDLRAPLRAIEGFNRIVLEEHANNIDEGGKTYLQNVENATIKMNSMINDMLSLAQIGPSSLTIGPIDLSKLTQAVFEEYDPEIADRVIDFKVNSTPPIHADHNLMKILLTNLISNAIKFTRESKPAVIEFGYQGDEGDDFYFLRDNGIGFDLNYAKNLFTPFRRLHSPEDYEGNGIGLAIVERIIKHHNGQIWVDSEVGKGTTFYFNI